ncbi:MAG: MerC domain-containing protein [SAR202 cluster bacterium]|nr:hypothetical protein [Chloroflexota bacterium]MQG34622.1 MerC domain-containing protein [SAR202 cluster bacterium]HCP22664.1 hypothetical protein [Dehalococcoidia bacterium]|tara:strand:- start:1584 stop:1892 length:309 start_codon:yes stop_codon:yes gene_type:complete
MLGRGFFPRIGAYAVLAVGFWVLFQGFERSNIFIGVLGGAMIIAGMYLMTGVWRDTFARFGGSPRPPARRYQIPKESRSSDDTPDDATGEPGDSVDGSNQGR